SLSKRTAARTNSIACWPSHLKPHPHDLAHPGQHSAVRTGAAVQPEAMAGVDSPCECQCRRLQDKVISQ
ncbi:MAG TPA: hypothetical protein PKK68_01845, partial [Methanothrix soehngenii]|nr:hypothetical protein [Methanothrix soehngenii]